MEKLVYAVWRREGDAPHHLSARLRADLPETLAELGVTGLQVNVADDDVAEAMVRITTHQPAIDGAVSLWVTTASDVVRLPIEAALREVVGSLAGWLVTESVPLANPRTASGARTPGYANLAFLRRPAELDQPEWLRRWQGEHTAVAIETQSTFGYTQNVVVRAVTPGAPAIDGIVEELFPAEAMTDLHAFFDTGGDDEELAARMGAMGASVAAFGADRVIDVVPTSRYVFTTPFA